MRNTSFQFSRDQVQTINQGHHKKSSFWLPKFNNFSMCLIVCFSYPAMHNKGNKSKFTLTFVCNQMWPSYFIKSFSSFVRTLPKAQRTRGLSSAYQSNFFRSYHKFLHKSWSNIFRILTKHQLQSLSQISAKRKLKNFDQDWTS